MFSRKFFTSILLAVAILIVQVGVAAAAPPAQEGTTTTITGTINEITTDVDENGETIIIVTLTDDQGATQIVTLTAQEAADNGLFDLTTQQLLAQAGEDVELVVDPTDVVPDEQLGEPDVHPISLLLAKFFSKEDPNMVNEMATLIDSFHTGENQADQVFGFGVIAQALWMAKDSEGNPDIEIAGDILQAKSDKDYDAFFEAHPEYQEQFGDDLPSNWGQFKKVLREKKNNLGVIVSGQAEDSLEEDAAQQDQGNDRNRQDRPKKEKKNKKH